MKKILIRSVCIATVLAIARTIYFSFHPEWSAPLWVPFLSALIGAFMAAFVVLFVIDLIEKRKTKK